MEFSGALSFPFLRKRLLKFSIEIYGRSTLGILQKNIALSSRAFLIKASLKGLPSRVSQFGKKMQTGVFDEGLSTRVILNFAGGGGRFAGGFLRYNTPRPT